VGLTGSPIVALTTAKANGMLESAYATELRTPVSAGVYHACAIDVADLASNHGVYQSTVCGGAQDLSDWLPSGTTITVTP
jgi:hypothetical protein